MKIELQQQLKRDFTFLDKGGCYFSCADGWYNLIGELCKKISERYKLDGKEPDIFIEEIKEKYGALRVEYSHGHFSGDNDDPDKKAALEKDIESLTDEYEEKSKTVCEICGAAGEIRSDLPWIQTLCGSCYTERLKRI